MIRRPPTSMVRISTPIRRARPASWFRASSRRAQSVLHKSYYLDSRNASDDTPMIREIAAAPSHRDLTRGSRARIGRGPPSDRSCAMRTTVASCSSTGTVGEGRGSCRWSPRSIRRARCWRSSLLGDRRSASSRSSRWPAGAGAVTIAKGRSPAETTAVAALGPVYAVAHGLGMWRGLLLATEARAKAPVAVILVIFGTTGELIKLMPVLVRLTRRGQPFLLVSTGQQVTQIPRLLELAGLPPVDLWLAEGSRGRDLRTNRDIPRWAATVAGRYLRGYGPLRRRLRDGGEDRWCSSTATR